MKYILMRTVSGKTYYARTEKNNAIKKTEDIALAQRFASEKDAKKMRDRDHGIPGRTKRKQKIQKNAA